MNQLDSPLHYLQIEIVKKLTLSPKLRFNELLIDGLESEHMNYHLQKLVNLKFVSKDGEYYLLSDSGKDYSNLMDDDIKVLEKQPKTSILLRGIRFNEETKEVEHLLTKRLRHPYFGKIGRVTGKVRFGESLVEAAQRELFEETGLNAKTFELENIYHKIRSRADGEFVQDVIFYMFLVKDFSGDFIDRLPHQENFWMSEKTFRAGDFDTYDDFEFDNSLKPAKLKLVENVGVAEGY